MQVIATFTLDNCWLKFRHYLCIGWGFPVIIVTMWASLIYATADKAVGEMEDTDLVTANATANAVRSSS